MNRKLNIESWLVSPLADDVKTTIQRLRRAPGVERIALMPDVHLAKDICVGCVVGTKRFVYPQAVGGDIGCGMTTIALGNEDDVLRSDRDAHRVLSAFSEKIPILKRAHPVDSDIDPSQLSTPALQRHAERDGRYQLGSVGRGNHFVELQRCDDNLLWVCVHSGSRSIGRKIMSHYLRGEEKSLVSLDANEENGQRYLSDQTWALNYARENRRVLLASAVEILSDLFGLESMADTLIECHHNHVRKELIEGEELWVHRKGAMPANEGERGIIPGSMGSTTYHVEGRGCSRAMSSSSHGAGRTCSRTDIRKKISVKDLHREMKGIYFDTRRAWALRDEAPSAYRDISKVMRAQKELTRIVRSLQPVLSYKG